MQPTHLDLFSGIGGFALAAQANGYRTVAFCEIEPYCQQVLIEKFGAVLADAMLERRQQKPGSAHGHEALHERRAEELHHESAGRSQGRGPRLYPNIFTLNGALYRGVDLLTGGFPCQPYSCAGKRRGAADDRALWPQMRRVIAEARPSWVLAENVPGIITMELDHCLSDLEALGYSCWPLVIPACAVDARHRRDRVWIMAHCASGGCEIRQRGGETGTREESILGNSGENVANRIGPRLEIGQEQSARHECETAERSCHWPDEAEWFPESSICRVAHGIPARAHRLRALGNAIVPQVASEIIRAIRESDSQTTNQRNK